MNFESTHEMNIRERLLNFKDSLPEEVTLIAVSKTKSVEEIMEAYDAGQRDFGENKVQELHAKQAVLPQDIRWHMIGHLQRNKVKYIAPYVHMIHGVDSLKLLREINKQGAKNAHNIRCLLQVHIAEESSKFGMDEQEVREILKTIEQDPLPYVTVCGLMGMATFTSDEAQIEKEFKFLSELLSELRSEYPALVELSMGMSGDFKLALPLGSTMVRIGSSIFGARN